MVDIQSPTAENRRGKKERRRKKKKEDNVVNTAAKYIMACQLLWAAIKQNRL